MKVSVFDNKTTWTVPFTACKLGEVFTILSNEDDRIVNKLAMRTPYIGILDNTCNVVILETGMLHYCHPRDMIKIYKNTVVVAQ